MRKALSKCCRNIRWKDSVVGYELHAVRNTYRLIDDIKAGRYKISPYQHFTIYEPKQREIVATRIKDRQFQMALCMGGLYDDITEHFIHDNCACQVGKGTDFALKRIKTHMRRFHVRHGKDGYVLKLDVHHFFPTTRRDVACKAIEKRVGDVRARQAVCDVINSFDGDIGIGLGSQISQLVELAVLDDLDHFIKEKLHIKYYVRYMELAKIHLSLNPKSCLYPLRQGIKFLHWHFYYTRTGGIKQRMDGTKTGKERRRLKALLKKEYKGEVPVDAARLSLEAWCANAKRGNTFFQQKRMIAYYEHMKGELSNGNNSRVAVESRT